MRIVRAKLQHQLEAREIHALADMEPSARSLEVCRKFDCSQASLGKCLKFVRQCNRLDFKRLRTEAEKMESAVVEFEAKLGTPALQRLRAHLPNLAEVSMQSIPCVAGDCFALVPKADDAVNVLALTSASSKLGPTAAGLEEDWSRRHHTIMHTDCEDVPEVAPGISLCHSFGHCVCENSEDGLNRRTFRNYFIRLLKEKCPPKSTSRAHLVSGGVVACLTATTPEGDELASFLHVGLQYLSPFECGFHEVELASDPDDFEVNPGRVYFKVCNVNASPLVKS
jgi:hypothetical protein